jgi:hypothetical protein
MVTHGHSALQGRKQQLHNLMKGVRSFLFSHTCFLWYKGKHPQLQPQRILKSKRLEHPQIETDKLIDNETQCESLILKVATSIKCHGTTH